MARINFRKSCKITANGTIYETSNFLGDPNESCTIADMRDIQFSEPHYHPETEMYFILQGSALIVIGNTEYKVSKGDELIISPNLAHYSIPDECVMAVVNTPPFNAENYFVLTETNTSVQFDYVEFKKLISSL